MKEFPYYDEAHRAAIATAAEFEHSVWRTGGLAMAEPVRTAGGELIVRLPGSRGQVVSVRVHRWWTARRPRPECRGLPRRPGRLAAVQLAGSGSALARPGSLHWWQEDPAALAASLHEAGYLPAVQLALARQALAAAEPLLAAAEQLPGAWTYTHCDFKPENSLLCSGQVAVLDWDERGYCHPRLEALESALRWAAADAGEPDGRSLRAILRGYQKAAGELGPLAPADFGKRIAALIYWIVFAGARALGRFDGTAAERRRPLPRRPRRSACSAGPSLRPHGGPQSCRRTELAAGPPSRSRSAWSPRGTRSAGLTSRGTRRGASRQQRGTRMRSRLRTAGCQRGATMASRFVYLMRHGEATDEGMLTTTGEHQSRLAGERLQDIPMAAIYHSPKRRAARTAEIIGEYAPDVQVLASELLDDFIPSDPDPSELAAPYAKFVGAYSPDERARGARLARAATDRFAAPAGSDQDTHELLITHNFLIGWFVRHALDAPDSRWLGLNQQNAALTVIRYWPEMPPALISFNDAAHLTKPLRWTGFPPAMRPASC